MATKTFTVGLDQLGVNYCLTEIARVAKTVMLEAYSETDPERQWRCLVGMDSTPTGEREYWGKTPVDAVRRAFLAVFM